MDKTSGSFVKALIELGFSSKEGRVYLALLELGKGTASEVARKASVNRTTSYDILDTLVGKNLVNITGKEPKQEYTAESPDNILNFLQKQLKEDREKVELAKEIIPQLKSVHNIGGRPKIRFYEGIEGLIHVYEDTLTSSELIRAYATIDDMHRTLPNYFPAYYMRRASKGISIRAILPKTKMGIERTTHNREELRESALIPPDKFYFSPEIDIYDDKVMIASWREKLGIIIESHEVADAMKKVFEMAWPEAKRLERESES